MGSHIFQPITNLFWNDLYFDWLKYLQTIEISVGLSFRQTRLSYKNNIAQKSHLPFALLQKYPCNWKKITKGERESKSTDFENFRWHHLWTAPYLMLLRRSIATKWPRKSLERAGKSAHLSHFHLQWMPLCIRPFANLFYSPFRNNFFSLFFQLYIVSIA